MSLAAGATFVDGFPVDPLALDYAIHAIIDGELRNCVALEGTRATPGLLYPAYFAGGQDVRPAWLEPALRRFAWHAGRQPWSGYLRGLLRLLISWADPPASDEAMLLLAQLGPQLESNGAEDCQVGGRLRRVLRTARSHCRPR